jgi:hypothetical protein
MDIIIPQELKRHIAKRLGLNHKTFFELEKTFAKEYERSIREKQESKKRERAPGGGRKRVLSPEGVFILVLIKLLFNPVFSLLGWMFRVSTSSSYRYFIDGLEALEKVLHLPMSKEIEIVIENYEKGEKKKVRDLGELLRELAEVWKLAVDGSEQEINRPKDSKKRKEYYSGKEKSHTVKVEIATEGKRITWFNGLERGSKHDFAMAKEGIIEELNRIELNGRKIELFADKGYEGMEKEIKNNDVTVHVPKKKRKKFKEVEKERNRIILQERIVVEHMIGKVKRHRILLEQSRFKNTDKGHRRLRQVYLVCCGLVNYGAGCRWTARQVA